MDAKAVRARVHLEGPVPAGTTEFVCVPTFNETVGLRLRGASLELWRSDEVNEVVLTESDATRFAARIEACARSPEQEADDRGRDGLVLLVRSQLSSREIVCFTTSGPSPWLELVRELLSTARAPSFGTVIEDVLR